MSEWQPIDSAPKDGTVCIVAFPLYNDVSKGLKVTAARFYEAEYCGDRSSGWEQLLDGDGVMTIWSPLFWMPLPEAPQ